MWDTGGGWDLGADICESDLAPCCSSAFGASLAMFWHCERLASTCLLASARDFGCPETMGTSSRHQLFWERCGGPG